MKQNIIGLKIRAYKRLTEAEKEFEEADDRVTHLQRTFTEAKDRLLKAEKELDEAKKQKEQADNAELHEVSKVQDTRAHAQVRDDADVSRVRVGGRRP